MKYDLIHKWQIYIVKTTFVFVPAVAAGVPPNPNAGAAEDVAAGAPNPKDGAGAAPNPVVAVVAAGAPKLGVAEPKPKAGF